MNFQDHSHSRIISPVSVSGKSLSFQKTTAFGHLGAEEKAMCVQRGLLTTGRVPCHAEKKGFLHKSRGHLLALEGKGKESA